MEVKCCLCEQVTELDDNSPLAKKLRNRPIHTYMCEACHERITQRTKEHFNEQEYKIYHRMVKNVDDW